MGGTNPYIPTPKSKAPTRTFYVTFENINQRIEVDPSRLPYQSTGLAGSILDIALGNGIEIDHACGGVCACSTCHVYVKLGFNSCSEPTEAELDMLDNAPDLSPISRLGCQCIPSGEEDVIVSVPDWNRNLIKEGT